MPCAPQGLCGPRRLGRRRVAEPHGRSGSAAPIRRDSDGLWYALFAMQARENARLVSEQPQNSIFNFSSGENDLLHPLTNFSRRKN